MRAVGGLEVKGLESFWIQILCLTYILGRQELLKRSFHSKQGVLQYGERVFASDKGAAMRKQHSA